MWLKSAPPTGSHDSKLREDNVCMLEPASTGKSLCPLSEREVKKGERGGVSRSPSPDGAVQKKEVRNTAPKSERQHGDVAELPRG